MRRYREEMSRTVKRLQNLGLKVLVVEPTPILTFNAIACLARKPADECSVEREKWARASAPVLEAIRDAVGGSNDIRSLNLLDFFCDDRKCYTRRHQYILYRDDNHITPEAAVRMTDIASRDYTWMIGLQSEE